MIRGQLVLMVAVALTRLFGLVRRLSIATRSDRADCIIAVAANVVPGVFV